MCNFYDFIFNRRGLIVSVFLVFLLTAVLLSCENPNSPSAPVNPDAPVPEVPFEKRTNVTVDGKDCELNIKWDKTENVYYTYVEILDGDKVIFSDVYSPNLKECSIIWLENDKEYTVKVYTQKTEQGTERTEPVILKGKPKKGEKKKSDYLVLMYMDGDNDLHDNLYEDINEV